MPQLPLTSAAIAWAAALAVSVCTFLALLFVRRLVRGAFDRMAKTNRTEVMELPAEVMSRTTSMFLCVVAVFLGAQCLDLSPKAEHLLLGGLTIAGFWQAGLWMTTAALGLLDRKRRESTTDRALLGSLGIIAFIARALIWAFVLLMTMNNLGIDITALVTGLGIGGIAVALAVQNVLGDVLASLSIALDKPFIDGDFLVVGETMGSVEYIGIKSTRLRSLGGEQIVVSNADLLSSRVRNYGRMAERRVVFTLGVAYETPRETLEQLPGLIRRLVEAADHTRFDRSHFAAFGPSSLDFETVYYVLSADYNAYMDVQQRIYFALIREFVALGVEFAYPTQKLWVAPVEAPASTDAPVRNGA